MKTAILVDSTAYLSPKTAQHPDVFQLSLSVHLSNGQILPDLTTDHEKAAFYQLLQDQEVLPTTSQPSPAAYYQVLDQIKDQGYEAVIGIFLSSGISGAYQTARMIFEEYQDRMTLVALDSKGASVVMEDVVNQALKMIQLGMPMDLMVEKLTWVIQESRIYLMVEDLDNLVKGGRLSAAGALIGGLLKIRPLLYFNQEGQIVVFEKIRTNKKVYSRWKELAKQAIEQYPYGVTIGFAHAQDESEIQRVADEILFNYPGQKVIFSEFGPVVGTHTGIRSKGMATIPQAPLHF
ncbi:DegV family protein [Vaginisenegalia massiliensis]|uniref:DegV family protein n=1 Tax=Vaginisenegalia massiliensis TaxID=2058294 RepID=UPI000F542138|nr:DegV family protein [Vaginisenegalia massiliensis]